MTKQQSTRTEKDSLGTVQVPLNAYYGSVTTRAKQNFQISNLTAPQVFEKSLGIVKLAAAQANIQLGLIPKKHSKALLQSCTEFLEGKFSKEFDLDVFQAGAGTSYNMNANEIIANRANELLKEKKGSYSSVHPNNHVNMAQSTNDVIPTATRIAALMLLPKLLEEVQNLEKSLKKLAQKYKNLIKVGRTHFQDAVPISLGQEFDSYRAALEKSRKLISILAKDFHVLSIGGTAVGTGITADPKYRNLVLKNLGKITKFQFTSAENFTEISNNMNSFLNLSSGLRSLAINLLNFSANLQLMNSGPKSGFGEITLPAVQPGSSIMPGKVNPSILESIDMICAQVLGNDKTIETAAQKGRFELNVMCPIIMHNLLQSIQILTNGVQNLRTRTIDALKVNEKRIKELFDNSLCTATALSPYVGYEQTAKIVSSALKRNITIKQEVLDRGILKPQELEKILSPKNTTNPSKNKQPSKK